MIARSVWLCGLRFAAICAAACCMVAAWTPGAHAQCPPVVGDVNADGAVTIVDAQCAIVTALWSLAGGSTIPPACAAGNPYHADINCSESINVVDVQLVIARVLQQAFAPGVDADGNGCPDTCEDSLDCCATDFGTGQGTGQTASCSAPSCASAVCLDAPFCCDVGWDLGCALLAQEICPECATNDCGDEICDAFESCSECPEDCGACAECGDGACDPDEDCVSCEADCGVCDNCGDGICAPGESCASCAADCGACSGDCCGPHGGVGCGSPACQACVCAGDPFCCQTSWDSTCAGDTGPGGACDAACPQCSGGCPTCGDACCDAHAGPGCALPACESCVCGIDDFCCDTTWDGLCADAATQACASPCECGAAASACCEPNFDGGCPELPCETCVCGEDPFCCDLFWDSSCVGIAADACEPDCGCTPPELSCPEALNCLIFCVGDAPCEQECLADAGAAQATTAALWQCLVTEGCLGDPDPSVFQACLSGPCAGPADACFL